MKTIEYYLKQPEGQTYDRKSACSLPGQVRLNNMRTTHFSRNPKIAGFMKDYEFIREFGEGVDRMYRELEEGGWEKPVFKQDDFMLRASLSSRFSSETSPKTLTKSHVKDGDVPSQAVTSLSQALSSAVPSLSPACPQLKDRHFLLMSMVMIQLHSQQCSISELMNVIGEKNKNRFRQFVLRPLMDIGLVESTIKDIPNSPKQRYDLTEKGKNLIESYEI